jgi:pimeloyl-ACP methyl ester carboxylesterase
MAEVVARGLRFHVQRLGAPAPAPGGVRPRVVFLHGLVMDNLSSFYFTIANPMAAVASVVLYDLRGHGKSERTPSGYGLDEMVLDLEALLDALEATGEVHLVGNSFGGLLALTFAARRPERVASVVLIDGHLGEAGWADRMAATLELRGEERDRRIAESFQSWLGRHSERKSTRLARTAASLVYETTLVADMRRSPRLDDAALARVRCPVLALYGEASDLRAEAEAIAARLPRCQLHVLPGCSHSVLWEATQRVRDDVVAWVARQAGRPAEAG